MIRVPLTPRANWQQTVEQAGLTFHSPAAMAPLAPDDTRFRGVDGPAVTTQPYWDESAAYQFTAAEVDMLESAANELQEMCLAAAQAVIDRKRYNELAIPPEAIPAIEAAWNAEPPALYGRFDLSWAGASSGQPPKLLEYNADTPTSLLEAAVIQWSWLEDRQRDLPGASIFHKADQFNSIHDRLIAKWKDIQPYLQEPVYFAALEFAEQNKDTAEDLLTVTYLRDTADQAGLQTRAIALQDIGWNPERLAFVDTEPDENQILALFKLYPWEAMLAEEFGPHALASLDPDSLRPGMHPMTWIEPIWKLLLSNKGILPILWQLYPNHPLLLPAYFEDHGDRGDLSAYVRKPLHSREGANISILQPGRQAIQTGGPYGAGPFIRQAIAPEAVFNGRHPVLGLWMIDQECGGMGIRESAGPITDNLSSFVPHYFL